MSITVNPVAPDFHTSGQILPEHVAAIAAAGYKTIINNRPDFEGGPDQPTSSAIAAAAKAAGLAYHHLPVVAGQYSTEQVTEMAELVNDAPKPVFCFCRSGARSTQLYGLAMRGT